LSKNKITIVISGRVYHHIFLTKATQNDHSHSCLMPLRNQQERMNDRHRHVLICYLFHSMCLYIANNKETNNISYLFVYLDEQTHDFDFK
jgi:hypothetical protein